jgi:drug/metabolite transporter (DMT)-like permease
MDRITNVSTFKANPQVAGIVCVVVGMVAIIGSDSAIKWISADYSLHQILLIRSLVAIVLVLCFMLIVGGRFRTARLPLHLARGGLLVIANLCYLLALAAMPIAEAMTLFFVAPLIITALSVPVLGEYVGPHRWAAVLIGMVGVIIMMRPGEGVLHWVSLLPIIAAFAYAVMQLLTRRLGTTDSAATMAFYIQVTFIAASILSGLALGDGRFADGRNQTLDFLFRAWVWPTAIDMAVMTLSGIFIAIGSYLLSQAYRIAEPNVVAPFEYSALPWGVIAGFVLWGDLPDLTGVFGIMAIVGAGFYILYRENVRRRQE